MGTYDKLIGETVVSATISPDREKMTLKAASGKTFQLITDGDCCSSTWIEHIEGEEALLGTITAVEDVDMPNLGNIPTYHKPEVEEVIYYGLRITTNKGRVIIDYRNSNNGFYGGVISLYELGSGGGFV